MRALKLLAVIALAAGMALAQAQAGSGLAAGTKVDAKLQNKLNAQNAKVGDKVTAVTTSAVKEHGKVVLPKGTRLNGRVTSVLAAQNAQSPSRIGILFDQATTAKGQTMPVHLSIVSVTQAAAQAASMPMEPPMPVMEPPMPMAGGAAAGGGLGLGGAVGGLGAAAGGALGAAASAPARMPAMPAMSMPRISVGSAAQAGAGSMLSVPQGNLVLQSGTRVKLVSTTGGGGQ